MPRRAGSGRRGGLLRRGPAAVAGTVAWLAAFLQPVLAPAGDIAKDIVRTPTETWILARGGRLYDNWLAELEADTPKGSHPAYPAAGRMKGYVTWRCVECHGYDYRGRDGAYGAGKHFTGIKGVMGVRGMAPEKIARIIRGAPHGFTAHEIPPEALRPLAVFLSRGLIDTDRNIDRKSRAAKGDARRGAPVFQTVCAVCHGLDGREITFSAPGEPPYLGPLCRENPWKALHKMRSGQPGVAMVPLASMSAERRRDVLAFCQLLPGK